jgi:hypothetical protein
MIDRLHGLKQRLGMRRPVRLLESAELAGPVAFGILRPTVAIPQGLHQTFTRDEVDAILAHELAHLAARDPLWQLIADATYSLAWWHPMLGWARRRLRMASEIAADEATQIVPRGPDALAAALVTLARTWTPQGRLAWLSLAERSFRSQLGRRVERLVKMSPEHPCSRRRSRPAGAAHAITLSLFLVLSAVGFTTWIRPQAALAKGETTMRVFHHSLRNSMAGVALAAVLATGGDASADPPPKEREAERRAGAERDHAEKSREEALRPRAEMAELQQHARRLKQAIGAAGEEKSDRTVELKRQLERISRRMADIAHEHGHAHEHGPVPEQRLQAIARQLEELRGHHHRLIEAGRREEAAEVERKIGHLERVAQRRGPLRDGELKGPIRDGERKGPLPREGDEHVERRVAHLLEAAKRLETLGAHDLAGAVRKEAEMLQRHFREHPREGDAKRREHAEHGEHAEHAARLHHTLRQMNAEMQELRASLEEMRGQLRELQGGDRPNRRETDRIRPDRPRPDGIRPDAPRPDRPGLDRPRPDRERALGDRPDRPRDGDRDKGDRDKGDRDKGDRDKGDRDKGDRDKGDKDNRDKDRGDKDKGDQRDRD